MLNISFRQQLSCHFLWGETVESLSTIRVMRFYKWCSHQRSEREKILFVPKTIQEQRIRENFLWWWESDWELTRVVRCSVLCEGKEGTAAEEKKTMECSWSPLSLLSPLLDHSILMFSGVGTIMAVRPDHSGEPLLSSHFLVFCFSLGNITKYWRSESLTVTGWCRLPSRTAAPGPARHGRKNLRNF